MLLTDGQNFERERDRSARRFDRILKIFRCKHGTGRMLHLIPEILINGDRRIPQVE